MPAVGELALPAYFKGNLDDRSGRKPQRRARPDAALEDLDDHGHVRAVRARIGTQSDGENSRDGQTASGGNAEASYPGSSVNWSRKLWSQLELDGEYGADASD